MSCWKPQKRQGDWQISQKDSYAWSPQEPAEGDHNEVEPAEDSLWIPFSGETALIEKVTSIACDAIACLLVPCMPREDPSTWTPVGESLHNCVEE